MTDSEIVFNEVLKEIVSVNDCLTNDENECEFCGGDSIVYIENDEWEECVFCCSSDTDTVIVTVIIIHTVLIMIQMLVFSFFKFFI